MKLNLYILHVEDNRRITGVDRHIQTFIEAIKDLNFINCYYIAICKNESMICIHKKHITNNCFKISIPLPHKDIGILNNHEQLILYSQELIEILHPFLYDKENRIIHIHTLNLIAIGLQIKKTYPCKIISHLHCIPWKYRIDRSIEGFNYLIRKYSKRFLKRHELLYVLGEQLVYEQSDAIICVTKNAKDFVKNMQIKKKPPIYVVPNGISVCNVTKQHEFPNEEQCIFVGNSSHSKGLHDLLKAAELFFNNTYSKLKILVVGNISKEEQKIFYSKYPNVNIKFEGPKSYKDLQKLYLNSTIGIIPSYHEQCSCTAIEMMAHKLPIICSNVDGLQEMFTHKINALTTPFRLSEENKLEINTQALANNIQELLSNKVLRQEIRKNAFKLYLSKYTAFNMTTTIIDIYTEITKP